MYLKGNCIKMLQLLLTGNMLNFQLFLIIGANFATIKTTTATNTVQSNIKINIDAYNTNRNSGDDSFVKFLKYVNQEQGFSTIVILTNWQYAMGTTATTTKRRKKLEKHTDYCANLPYYVEQHLTMPVLLLQPQQTVYTLYNRFNSEFLTVVCFPPSSNFSPHQQFISKVSQSHLLQALSKNLLYLRTNRVIFRMDFNSQGGEYLQTIEKILKYCHKEQIINVIIVSYRFPYNDTIYYSYEKFPEFKIKQNVWLVRSRKDAGVGEEQKLFPNQLRDLKGYRILTLPDQIEPRTIVYYDKQGKQQFGGYLGNFLHFFAKGLNASLVQPYEVQEGVSIFFLDMMKLVRNYTVDIPAGSMPRYNGVDFTELSYPFDATDWCVLLPLEKELSTAEIFLAVLNPYFVLNAVALVIGFTFLWLVVLNRSSQTQYRLTDILLNDKALRGVLGQSFPWHNPKYDYFMVFVIGLLSISGIICVTLYTVYLGSFMSCPPKHPPIKSFAQLDESDFKLVIYEPLYNGLNHNEYYKYRNLFHIESNRTEILRMRNSFNTSFAYTLASLSWPLVEAKQRIFARKVYRYSTDICIKRNIPFFFLLPMHSVFREPLQHYTLKAYSSGLYNHWFDSSFRELVSLGRMSLTDITEPPNPKPLTLHDFSLIFYAFSLALVASVIVLIGEMLLNLIFARKMSSVKNI